MTILVVWDLKSLSSLRDSTAVWSRDTLKIKSRKPIFSWYQLLRASLLFFCNFICIFYVGNSFKTVKVPVVLKKKRCMGVPLKKHKVNIFSFLSGKVFVLYVLM